jgi:toxin HigB-1
MIKSFRCLETEKIFQREFSKKFQRALHDRAFMKLNAIDAAVNLEDLRQPPSNRLETLKGDRKGQYSIRINDRWRICFEWRNGKVS